MYEVTVHADVLALLPDPATARICLDVAEDAARAVCGTMAAAHVGADPARMIAAPEEIDLQMLRDLDEGSPAQRLERVTSAFEDWKQAKSDRERLLLDDCRGDLNRCVTSKCHEAALVVAPCHGNMDARDAFHDLLFNEQKLVLAPPPGPYRGNLLGHVVIGWKPHDHAQRAVVAARRWLAAADRVTVLCVNDKPDGSYQFTARELIDQLGLKSDVVAIDSGSRSVAEAILDFARSANATCLLIGAFKHGYFLELLLGRITRHLLSHAALPLMMKH
ncbi:universal stress protein [Rhizobium fabae]|uniref:Nucleotide-binding universal stress UspA family protein n=1 Tax=Rhizobium fabae TaxID=573179 RepID=A0A7W6FKU7_9HYPH|nr:universal stress protein [Rhizobium fabae]MBB3917239.1 nucleotide-binding universal stress UspA family protein [Rhizobium fabae]RUM10287.1 universal stress protein [Rhizobium fabae]